MTYPPQPGQGGDPHGQGWQQPGTGGVPQQPGWDPNAQQQPAWDPNAQHQQQAWDPNAQPQQAWDPNAQQQQAWDPNAQQYPGGQYPQQPYQGTQQFPQQGWDQGQYPGGPGGEPPKGNKTGLWIGIAVAVVLVAALGITGFVAPGFFLSKDKTDNQAQTQSQAPSPSKLAPPSKSSLPTDDETAPTDTGSPSTGLPGGADTSQGKQLVTDFIAKINAKDQEGALTLVCPSSKSSATANIQDAIGKDPQLQADSVRASEYLASATVSGTLSGRPAHGLLMATPTNGVFCVSSFFAF